jgi:hypothetical protein
MCDEILVNEYADNKLPVIYSGGKSKKDVAIFLFLKFYLCGFKIEILYFTPIPALFFRDLTNFILFS